MPSSALTTSTTGTTGTTGTSATTSTSTDLGTTLSSTGTSEYVSTSSGGSSLDDAERRRRRLMTASAGGSRPIARPDEVRHAGSLRRYANVGGHDRGEAGGGPYRSGGGDNDEEGGVEDEVASSSDDGARRRPPGDSDDDDDDGGGEGDEASDDDQEEVGEEEECGGRMGIFGWHPEWLQCYRTPQALLFWLCCAAFLQGMVVNGLVNVIITTIERRFQLRSTESGMVASFYDVGYFLIAFPVTFFGGQPKASKPRWIGTGVLMMGLGSLVFALPHFVAPSMMSSTMAETDSLCHVGGTHAERACQGATETFFSSFKYIFYLGQFLHGVGAAPLYTLGVTLIDDVVSVENSPLYLGIFYSMAVVGPAVGFFVGGESLKQHTQLTLKVAELGLSAGSNMWVGAWWVGFLIAAIVSIFVAIPILMFPCRMPGVEELREEKTKPNNRTHQEVDSKMKPRKAESLETSLKDFPCHLLLLLKNPTFVALTMAAAAESGLMAGMAVFLPKFVENQFSLQASMAALLVGSLTVPAGGGGTFLGGYLVRRLKLNMCGKVRLCLFAAFASALLSFVFLLDCPNMEMAGKTVGYSNTNNITRRLALHNLTDECNRDCACSEYRYEPMCGADGFMYYSPCHAGCLVERRDTSFVKVFMDCNCLTGFTFRTKTYAGRQWNVQGVGKTCDNHCPYLNIYIFFLIGFAYITLLDSVPSMSATLRCVPEEQRSLALGLQIMYVKLFGTIPAPVMFGRFFDSTCRLWQKGCPTQGGTGGQLRGNCRFYDNYWMSRYMLLSALTGKTMTFVYYSMAYFSYKSPQTAGGAVCFDWEKCEPSPRGSGRGRSTKGKSTDMELVSVRGDGTGSDVADEGGAADDADDGVSSFESATASATTDGGGGQQFFGDVPAGPGTGLLMPMTPLLRRPSSRRHGGGSLRHGRRR